MTMSMLRYTLRQLEYLIACIDTGSLSAAAKRLHVSQPSISVAIAKLEDELGTQLLIRHHAQGVRPTASAERLLLSARGLMAHAQDLQAEAQASGAAVSGKLKLGSFSTLAAAYLPGMMQTLATTYPDVKLQVSEGTQDYLIDGLRQGQYDIALMYDFDIPDEFEKTTLAEVFPYVALPEDHPLADNKHVSLASLKDEPMILLDILPSRQYFLDVFNDLGLTPNISHTSPSIEMVRGLVGCGMGYSLLATRPHSNLTYRGDKIAVRPILDHVRSSHIILARLRALRPTGLVIAFDAFARSFFATQNK